MTQARMLKHIQPKMEKMLGRGRFVILNVKYINRIIDVEYLDQNGKHHRVMFSVDY